MTVTTTPGASGGAPVEKRDDTVTLTIDGIETTVPKGTLVIRAAEQLGIAIPRFCDHPLLEPAGACRQCLVVVEGQPKPLASCTSVCTEGMVVRTQLTSEVAETAQRAVMEFLLINHPLDCPICDKGGECPLQNQAMSTGRGETRFDGPKRTFPKPIPLSSQILLDRERCISCARCTRFADQIAGDPYIELVERGSQQQVGIASPTQPFNSYFSGNTIQICPVGALTSALYRFRARPFDLVSTPSACEHCASGCALRTDHRRGVVVRRMAGTDPEVNEEWTCDKGRFAFRYPDLDDRITAPMVRDEAGVLVPTSWPDALDAAARGLAAARSGAGVAVLTGGRLTVEDAYAYAKLARVVLGTNDIDFRARAVSAEETALLAARVAGRGIAPSYADLGAAPAVLLVAFEPEEESPIVFLRLRKAVRSRALRVWSLAPYASRGLGKLGGRLVPAVPGTEAAALAVDALPAELVEALSAPGAVVLVGERIAEVGAGAAAVAALVDATGARLGWVPRRAGDRGALEAGAFPALLPAGRPVTDAAARVDVAAVWGVDALPAEPGRDTAAILAAAAAGGLGALVVGGVDVDDLPDPDGARAALDAVPFLVSLELRSSAVTSRADVVLPVAPVTEKPGTFLDWEGRPRRFPAVFSDRTSLSDARVLALLAETMGTDLRTTDPAVIRAELAELDDWEGARPEDPQPPAEPTAPAAPQAGQAVLSSWRLLLDDARLQEGEPHLAGTAHPAVVRLSPATATEVGAADGALVTVTGAAGSVTLPLVVTAMPDRVVWLPGRTPGAPVSALGARPGDVVAVSAGPADTGRGAA